MAQVAAVRGSSSRTVPAAGGQVPAPPVTGTLGAHLALAGTVAAPTARAAATLEDGRLEELGPLGVASALELPGDAADLTVAARLDGAPLLTLQGRVPLDLAGMTNQAFVKGRAAYGGQAQSTQIVKLLEDVLGTDLRAPGFPARLE